MSKKQLVPLVGLALVWGCYYVASQQTVKGMSVFSAGIVIRFLVMILLTVLMVVRGEFVLLFQTRKILGRLLLIGLLGFLLDLTAFIGLSLSPAGSGTALLKCDVIFVNLISALIYKTRFTQKDWAFSLMMLFGVFLILGVRPGNLSLGGKGGIFFILSALFVSINAFVIKSVQLDPVSPAADNVVAYYNNFVTMLLFTAASLAMGTIGQIGSLAADPGLLAAGLLAGLGQTGIYLLYYYDLRRFPVWIVKVYLLLMPMVSTLVTFGLFGEKPDGMQCVGMAVALGGALGILLEQNRKEAQSK